jgi:hypothetical protein
MKFDSFYVIIWKYKMENEFYKGFWLVWTNRKANKILNIPLTYML